MDPIIVVVMVILAIVAIAVIVSCVKIVPQANAYVIEKPKVA